MSRVTVRVASWPHWYAPNPYLPAFYEALEPWGIEHVPGVPLEPAALRWADVAVLHVHWPYPAWHGRPAPLRPLAVARFLRTLSTVRRSLKIAWTVHNHGPHEGAGVLDRTGYRGLHRRCDLQIHHSDWSLRESSRLWGPTRAVPLVVPHGTYDGRLPPPRPARDTRRALGVSEGARLLVCPGQVRAYKGLDVAIDALRLLDGTKWRLVIAGRPISGVEAIRARAADEPRVTLVLEAVDDQHFSDLIGAADAVLLPYRSVTGSGALAAALTLRRGVVTSDLPYFREALAPEPRAGEVARAEGPEAFAAAVRRFFEADPDARAEAVGRLADRYDWSRNVEPVGRWMRRASRHPRS